MKSRSPAKTMRHVRRPGATEEFLGGALSAAWRHYAACRRACRRKPSPKHVHAFRIASRQLISIVMLVAAAAGRDATKIRAQVKRGLRATARLRDLDAQLQRIRELMAREPALHDLAGELGLQRARAADAVRWKLARLHGRGRVARLGRALFEEFPDGSAEQAVRATIDAAIGRVRARLAPGGQSDRALHRARLALKKLRYMGEALAPRLPARASAWVESLHQQQRTLGQIHDHTLLLARLRRYRPGVAGAARKLRQASARLERERRALLRRHARHARFAVPSALKAWLRGD